MTQIVEAFNSKAWCIFFVFPCNLNGRTLFLHKMVIVNFEVMVYFLSLLHDTLIRFFSIEYWPDPQRGIKEAYRVLKIGGKACVIGPVYPTFWLSRFFADVWMLFPKEEEYIEWFQKAGFKDVKLKRIGPKWYRGVRRHGLIMGCSVTGVKPLSGDSPLQVTSFL